MEQVSNGKMRAFEKLFNNYSKLVYGYCYKILKDQEKAEDVAQETWMKVIRYAENYKGQSQFTAWLMTVTRNTCFNYIRANKRFVALEDESQVVEEDVSADMFGKLVDKQNMSQVREKMMELPDNQRSALVLFAIEDMSYDEIADEMNLTVSSVKSLIFRARKNLETSLEDFNKGGQR